MARPSVKTTGNRKGFSNYMLRKLEEAFMYGLNNAQACLFADISESLFYEVCENNEELSERFKLLQQSPKIRAIRNVVDEINKGDVATSKWYLERKARDDFSLKQELTPEENQGFNLVISTVKNGQNDLGSEE